MNQRSLVKAATALFLASTAFSALAEPIPAPDAQIAAAAPGEGLAATPAPAHVQAVKSKRIVPADLSADNQAAIDRNRNVATEGDELDSLRFLEEKRLNLAKVKLEVAKTDSDREKVEKGEAPTNTLSQQTGMPGQMPGMMGGSMMPGMQTSLPKEPEKAPIDRLFVTRIFGFDKDKTATVFLDNSVFEVAVGETVAEGVRVSAINDSTVVFTKDGKSRTVPLTTENQAYQRSNAAPSNQGTTMSVQRYGM
ncbi:hypothetical protein HNP46_000214 [Pseudomonas nitritireducens]|uniref:Type IV pilus biogenesis protein PilP n=1 Tax=Pseudomonas nitroreducens TaxID=46680 RepID=A0A7W7KFM4_PSENT|nr:hypothetical protein [Pseudomonas nitritireducens]MBB4861403.1 hypothetical protein [Pseudomonas nitritireducens]